MDSEATNSGEAKAGSKRLLVVAGIVVALLVGLGVLVRTLFNKAGERLATSVEKQGEVLTFKSDEGQVSVGRGSLPEGFPSDFPIYSGATVAGSVSSDGESGKGQSVVLETKDPVERVAKFYVEELPKQGWKIVSNLGTEDSATLGFEKEGYGGFLGATREGADKTTISITLSVK